jgi:hypothetical protein
MKQRIFLTLLLLMFASAVFGANKTNSKATPSESEVGVEEKLGEIIP